MPEFSVSHFLKLDLTAPCAFGGKFGIALLVGALLGAASQAVAAELPGVEAVTYDGPMVMPHEFAGDMRLRSVGRRAECQRRGSAASEGGEFVECLHGHAGVDNEQIVDVGDTRNEGEVLERVIRQFREQVRIDAQRISRRHQ